MAVLACREGLQFDPAPTSDSGPLVAATGALRAAQVPVRAMRDATRGGVAAVLHEWAEASRTTMVVDEDRLPVNPEVQGACELLGLDPLCVANEGTMVVAVPPSAAGDALRVLREVSETTAAVEIGEVESPALAAVVVRRALGQRIPLDEPLGAPLPRIC
jgi:hydrogenase expression/formation protein HypE